MNKDIMKKLFPEETEAVEHGFCPFCKSPICLEEFRDNLSIKEFNISGLCQKCQDKIFVEPEE